MSEKASVVINVREYGGAHIASGGGMKTSCTSRAIQAVQSVAVKVKTRNKKIGYVSEEDLAAHGITIKNVTTRTYIAEWGKSH